jgi:hypothetical protein
LLDREFLEKTNPIIDITTPYIEIANRINEIEFRSKSSYTTFDDLIELCFQLVCRLPAPIVEIDVPFLVRARPGYSSNGNFFSCIGDLSYNPNIYNISQGRFNLEREPIFYACVPCQTLNGDTAFSAIVESYKEILDKGDNTSDKYCTVSRWDINKTFLAINFSMYDKAEKNNLSVKKINREFINQTLKNFSCGSFESFMLLCRFMSAKASSKKQTNSDYLITNAYKKALEKYYGSALKAIIYSSVMSEHNGLNIALSKEPIDKGDIRFHGACVYKIMSHPYKLEKTLIPCTNFVKSDPYGNFKFKFSNIKWLYN